MNTTSVKISLIAEESVRYCSDYFAGTNPFYVTLKHLFKAEGAFFSYFYSGNYTNTTRILTEISEEVYLREKANLLEEYSWVPLNSSVSDDDTKYSLYLEENKEVSYSLDSENIKVSSDTSIKRELDKALEELEAYNRAEAEKRDAEKKEHAHKCGKLSRKYGIPFSTALALGDEKRIIRYWISFNRLRVNVGKLTQERRDYLCNELYCGRDRKGAALRALDIEYYPTDPNRFNLTDIVKLLEE